MARCIDYRGGFLGADEAWGLFAALRDEVVWTEESLTLFGRAVRVPRRLAWYGNAGVNYRYSGADHRCDGWPAVLAPLRRRLEEAGVTSNLVLLNRYRHGDDYMGWHADDERGLAANIASISLGACRRFLVRPAGAARATGLDLGHGSLLLMDGRLRHSLPRTRRPVGERINLTFRLVAS